MKKAIAVLLSLLTVLALCAACGKETAQTPSETDPNEVLTDSDVALEVGAELGGAAERQDKIGTANA